MADVSEAVVPPPAHLLLTTLESSDAPWEDEFLSAWARWLFWLFGLALGLMGVVTSRFSMNADGISYLDLAQDYLHSGWSALVNGYWSPFYPWLLGAGLRATRASMYWESTSAHALNFLVFAASMAAFEVYLRELCHRYRARASAGYGAAPLPVWAMQAFGYSLFLYGGLVWITVGVVSPDQCVAVAVYLIAALLLHLQGNRRGLGWCAVLGVLLGIGYLAKAILFPLGVLALAAIPFLAAQEGIRKRLARFTVAAVFFAALAVPLVVPLSRAKGRLTFGDTGKLNYAMFVDGLTIHGHWAWDGNLDTLKHPVRKVSSDPSVYEFAEPVGGTYPPWYDQSYWLDGVQPHLNVSGQIRVLGEGARAYAACLLEQAGFVVAWAALFALDKRNYSLWRNLGAAWPGWGIAIAGLGAYLLVHVETRLVGSFLVIAGMSALGAIRLLPSARNGRLIAALALAFATLTLFSVATRVTQNLYSSGFRPRNVQWEVAEALAQRGITPGEKVATIIDHRMGDYWAHLASVKIVLEIPAEEMPKVAALTPDKQVTLIRTLQSPGAKAIVTTPAPPEGTGFRWEQLGSTNYFVALFVE
jgi:hypothetical protein